MTRLYPLLRLLITIGSMILMSSALAETKGESIYINNCMVCHADDGSGAMPGVSDLTKNQEWLRLSETILLSRLKKGIQKPGATVSMPPKGGNPELTDEDLRSVIAYMRNVLLK